MLIISVCMLNVDVEVGRYGCFNIGVAAVWVMAL